MNKNILSVYTFLLLTLAGCSSDDISPSNEPDENLTPTEEISLDANKVSKGILIEGAIKKSGTPPSPNGNVSFSLSNTTQSAFLKNGFNITFEAPTDYAGAYIQIKSIDGNLSNEYFDAPLSSNRTILKHSKSKYYSKTNTTKNINIDFDNTITPGKFCYIINIYNTSGNISAPIEACIEVESWAGNSNLVGTWNYTKQIKNEVTTPVGEINFCEGPESITCNNQEILIVPENDGWCYASTEIKLELKENGSYTMTDLSFQRQSFNNAESTNLCTIIKDPVQDNFGTQNIYKGFWAYNEEKEILYLIEFEYKSISLDDNSIYEDSKENGYLSDYSGKISLNNPNLIITFEEFSDFKGVEFHFSK